MPKHRNSVRGSGCARARWLLEQLEARRLFDVAPMPALADLEDPTNPVVRFETGFGPIDVELLRNEAPVVVDRVLELLARHRLDRSFFHRAVSGQFMQGGEFNFSEDRPGHIEGAIPHGFEVEHPVGSGRANTARTVSVGVFLDSAPIPVFSLMFNLTDNTARFNPTDFVVFARVVGDASWGVVQTVAGLPTADLAGTNLGTYFPGSMHDVPLARAHQEGAPVVPDDLAQVYDAAVIRGVGVPEFYRYAAYSAEGFSGATISEFVPMVNPNAQPVYYQIFARYERDGVHARQYVQAIGTGVIGAGARGGVTICTPTDLAATPVVIGTPYAIEIRSTLPLAAQLSHYDFGGSTGEAFTDRLATAWTIPDAAWSDAVEDFMLWYNPGAQRAHLTVRVRSEAGAEVASAGVDLSPFRRGGMKFKDFFQLPEGVYAMTVDSDQPILVSHTHYEPRATLDHGFAYSSLAMSGAASAVGVVPTATNPQSPLFTGMDTQEVFMLSVANPSNTTAVVNIDLYDADGATARESIPAALTIPAHGRATYVHSLVVPNPTPAAFLSLIYRANVGVYASLVTSRGDDAFGSASATTAARDVFFADGFIDPARTSPEEIAESIRIFNPNSAAFGVFDAGAQVEIIFHFTDGTSLTEHLQTVVAGGFRSVSLQESSLGHQLLMGPQYYFYGVEVRSDVPLVVEMMHTDNFRGPGGAFVVGGGFSTLGVTMGQVWRLDDLG